MDLKKFGFHFLILSVSFSSLIAYEHLEIGVGTYGVPNVRTWGEGGKVTIGKYCSIASGVTILLGGDHRTDWVTTYPFMSFWGEAGHIQGHPKTKGNVVIGNDVWIGLDAFILSGVKIGDGAVIGARAVVTKDVPPYAIVAGNPARIVRFRFDKETIEKLQRIAWWDWPESEIRKAVDFLLSDDIESFINHFEWSSTALNEVP
jgi:acetyltransferase-like isoleucine patch superfamily enzyme